MNTTPLSYRIDSNLKKDAENILSELGLSPTSAIQMFYKQIVIQQGLPFEVKKVAYKEPLSLGSMTKEQLDTELAKGVQSFKEGRTYTQKEVDEILAKEFGI